MNDEPLTMEAEEVVDRRTLPQTFGVAFSHVNTVKGAIVERNLALPKAEDKKTTWAGMSEFLKPTLSNLFLAGCLIGLFVLYCCSCIVHALTFAARRKQSS